MQWYSYIIVFFAGAFLSNAIPHFVYGVCGNKFPTPFAKPPGQGLSSAIVNVVWGGLNIVIGYLLFKAGPVQLNDTINTIVFFAGFMLMALMSASNFKKKHKE